MRTSTRAKFLTGVLDFHGTLKRACGVLVYTFPCVSVCVQDYLNLAWVFSSGVTLCLFGSLLDSKRTWECARLPAKVGIAGVHHVHAHLVTRSRSVAL
jgi:hypothetical protein